jgi:hypothetical protein
MKDFAIENGATQEIRNDPKKVVAWAVENGYDKFYVPRIYSQEEDSGMENLDEEHLVDEETGEHASPSDGGNDSN